MKIDENFSYLKKFEPDTPNSFEDFIYEKLETLQRMYGLINFFFLPPSNFAAVFDGCYFPLLLLVKSLKLYKLLKLINSFNFYIQYLHTVPGNGVRGVLNRILYGEASPWVQPLTF